jgi:hypothetical protein
LFNSDNYWRFINAIGIAGMDRHCVQMF